jgi:hypothetical protein
MGQETPNPKQEVHDLAKEQKEAMKDSNIDETEKQALDRMSQKLREFAQQKEGEEAGDWQKRQSALESAIKEVATAEKMSETEVYTMIWGEVVEQIMEEFPFSLFPELEKWKKKVHPLVLKHRIAVIARKYPFMVIDGFDQYKNESFAEEVLTAVAESKEPELLLTHYRKYADAPYSKGLLEKGVIATANKKPTLLLRHYSTYKGEKYAFDVLKIATLKAPASILGACASGTFEGAAFEEKLTVLAMRVVAGSPTSSTSALKHLDLYKTRPQMHDTLKQALLKADVHTMFIQYKQFRELPFVGEVMIDAAKRDTAEAVGALRSSGDDFKDDIEIVKVILRVCVDLLPNHVEEYLSEDYGDNPHYSQMIQEAVRVSKDANTIEAPMSFAERKTKLHDIVQILNSELISDSHSALDTFNAETGLSMECMGIRSDNGGTVRNTYFEYVFINTFAGKNKIPVRIALNYEDVKGVQSKEEVLKLLRKKYEQQQAVHKKDYELWNKQYSYDLPKNGKTGVMFAMVPGSLSNVETDMLRMAEIYKGNYGASFSAVCVQKMDEWEKVLKEKNAGALDFPEAIGATEKEILDTLVASLKKAIDEGLEAFVFHYMMHGGEEGTISASDGSFSAEKIAQAITTEYNGKPLSAQIDITIFKESCFSGSQIEKETAYFKEQNSDVKNLHIIAAVSKHAPSDEGLELKDASVVSEKMRGNQSAALHYNISYYFELMDHLKSTGVKIEEPVGSYSHAIQFADLMTREDSRHQHPRHGQNPEGFHYSTEKDIEDFFSRIDNKLDSDITQA